MFKKILVATDASEYSQRALKTALEIAQKYGAEVELLFVTYIREAYWGYNVTYGVLVPQEQIDESGERALDATLEGIDVGDVVLKRKKVQGYPATMILEEVEKEGIDLVVMGSHGYGPITGSLLGSVSQHVLHRAECPVLIVK
ncbi:MULTISPECIES: universal stress protein [Desulfosporosinus]|uniref:Universal stress protein n=1 Tax=Desulfosporosinus nitroreducens TaxID=2018668 RepID=A0ABT8QTK9_9FIRM|nr:MULTISPECIES: universal stress protein [Desulfosporosinus]MCO1602356.1 universal stress protein [Desulfosporosinus nitroreducens]MCO5388332.1 universal stress protein [Desulfosporosinus sp.]MDA8221080.1 universal stress protein [Desulfitobacterium hafniense]MDO0824697.1 universal stress protein [Desulfosporosinus nitroreducens]